MINESEVKNIVRKILDEEHLIGLNKIFEKEHNIFRGSHDKINLPEDLSVPEKIIQQVIEGGNFFRTITGITNDVVAGKSDDILTLGSGNAILGIVGTAATKIITFTVNQAQIDHNALLNYASNRHFLLGETETTAYRGDRGKSAYDHSQIAGGNSVHVSTTENTNWDAAYSHIHNLTTDINHDALTNFAAGEHFTMLGEDDMASNSATQAATQQSIKAYVDALPAGVSTFVGLTDTPANYTNKASHGVFVNATPDGLEFPAGFFYDTTDHNLCWGPGAGVNLTSGEGLHNVFLGEDAGAAVTTGDEIVAIGYQAGFVQTTVSGGVFIGHQAGYNNTVADNVFIGREAGYGDAGGITGVFNVGIGATVGHDLTNGYNNVFLGYQAGWKVTSGHDNFLMGKYAGRYITTGYHNTFIGASIGSSVGATAPHQNVFIGAEIALAAMTSANRNVVIGVGAANKLTSGYYNTLVGNVAGWAMTSGWGNTLIGRAAGFYLATGFGNVFIGYQAGFNETGSNKLYIANTLTATPLIYGEFPNTLLQITAPLHVGRDGATVGALTLWDGAGGNTPGYAKIHSPNGTAWYVFIEDDGTVKIHNAVPTANADGSAIGDQAD